ADDKVLFIDASREYADGKNQNVLRAEDIQKIIDTCHKRESVDKYAYLTSPEEIAENDFNLNIPRYVDTFEEEEEIDLMAVRAEREKLKAELATLEEEMEGYLKELGYGA
ncbi:N-6 DNA methylase, partial [Thiolapillus sp.]